MKLNTKRACLLLFLLLAAILAFFSAKNYEGNIAVYLLFTVSFNTLLILGFCKHRIFFDTFIGVFFWLGFWLKFSVRIAFMASHFQEPVGRFNFTGGAYDQALLVSSCGVLALLLAHYTRRSFFSYNRSVGARGLMGCLYGFYRDNRRVILGSFCCFFVIVACANVICGIYQRGTVPRTILPFGMNGIVTWLLLFGLSSFSAVILDCELRQEKNPYTASIIGLLECFFSNSAMLSRGMILNGSSLLFGMHETEKRRSLHLGNVFKCTVIVIFGILFVFSVFAVNHIRTYKHAVPIREEGLPDPAARGLQVVPAMGHRTAKDLIRTAGSPAQIYNPVGRMEPGRHVKTGPGESQPRSVEVETDWPTVWKYTVANLKLMVIDRWVGIEGAMAVSSYPHLGWGLWKKAWNERFSHTGTSLYDTAVLSSPYVQLDLAESHFINLPGILAFLFYPGSYLFLLAGMFLAGIFGGAMELFVCRLSGGNIILCALMAQVLAYRYAHFGYAPRQTYMLLGTMVLNVIIIYSLMKAASLKKAPARPVSP
jgi:hypothetical protein